MNLIRRCLLSAFFICFAAGSASSEDTARLFQALKNGTAFAMMRHALAPGTGDPAGIVIGDCATQRNLNDVGRDQARAIGLRFRVNGIQEASVYTSQWCRCRETAALLDIGAPEDLVPLNSFYEETQNREPHTRALREWLIARDWDSGQPLVLVTHQVNISALTGSFASSGETIVARIDESGNVTVLGTF